MEELVFKGQNDQVLTNSVLVAQKFGKEHQHVLRDIRNLVEGMSKIGDTPMFVGTTYVHPQNGQTYPMFVMNRDGFTLLAMGFTGDKALQFKLDYINAFNKMEEELKKTFKVPQSFREALLLAAQQQEEIEKQQARIAEMKPKEEFFDQVTDSKDACDMATVAKVLNMGIGRNKLFMILRNKKVLQENNQPFQRYVDCGWFRVVESHFSKPNGDICINYKTIVFQKGVAAIRRIVKEELGWD